MGDGFQFIDIILFAMIAAFLVLRLRSVLGRRNGQKGKPRNPVAAAGEAEDNVVRLPDDGAPDEDDEPAPTGDSAEEVLAAGLVSIRTADSAFDPQEFLVGTRVAFEMILDAYASGDTDTLKPMLSADVFGNFNQSIRDREKAGEVLEETLVGIKSADIMEAYLENGVANITVKLVSEQISAVRDEGGDVVDGDPNVVTEVTDFWTFARNTRARDPNWMLVATRSVD